MSEEKPREYGMFNGRRDADKYVRGWLAAVTAVSGFGLTIFIAFTSWIVLQVQEQQNITNEHEIRLTRIEANRFTMADANNLMGDMRKELQLIRTDISKLPKEAPPLWVKELIMRNSEYIRELQKKENK